MSKVFSPRIEWAKNWLKDTKSCYINGEWVMASGSKVESYNPATGELNGTLQGASEADVNAAVQAAREAFDNGPWKTMPLRERGAIMRKLAVILRENCEEIATIETLDNGKLFTESLEDVENVATFMDYYSGWVDKHYGDVNPVSGNFFSYTIYEPIGVCGQIIPWNYPMDMAGFKLGPALAMGNTIVMKPSSVTSFSMIRFVELIHEAGILPKGVLNLIVGKGSVGSFISRHEQVDKLAFTGSTGVGRTLIHDSADSNMKPLTLELGGKSPNIIFADAPDLDFAISRSFVAMFCGKGEKCSEPTRLFVERPVYQKVVDGLVEQAKSWKVGDPFDPSNHQGAQVSKDHFDSIMNYIEIGKQEGARLVCGGDRNVEGSNANGYFINPTIFADCTNEMRISREEIFGPVLVVIPFDTEEEAVAMANDSPYGLAAGFWTADIARTQRVAKQLQAGQIFINRYGNYDPASPFGGNKTSGWGKECAKVSLENYTHAKAIWYAY